MATVLPRNLDVNQGRQSKFDKIDNWDYRNYPKDREVRARAWTTTRFTGAANITLTPAQLATMIILATGSTFTTITLPATALWAAFLQRIFSVGPETGTPGSGTGQAGEVYYIEMVIRNDRASGNLTMVAGDGSTTFIQGADTVNLGINQYLIKFTTSGSPASATLEISPLNGSGSTGPVFSAIPNYTPFPLQDGDVLPLWDISNGNLYSKMTRQQFLSGGTATSNILLGPGSNYGTTGVNNVGLGSASMAALSTGTNNVAVGFSSQNKVTTAVNNTSVGSNSLLNATTGGGNTAIGNDTLKALTDGINNTAVGSFAAQANTTGDQITALGTLSLAANTTAKENTAVGYNALGATTTGGTNTAVGVGAGLGVVTGTGNITVGVNSNSLAASAAATNSIMIGNNSSLNNAAQNNLIVIGHSSQLAGAFASVTVIGNSFSPTALAASSTFTDRIRALAGGNAISAQATGELTQAVSNKYVKYDIQDLDDPDLLEKIQKLRPIKYKGRGFRLNKETDEVEYIYDEVPQQHFGLLVSEVDKVIPEAVYHGDFECYSEKQQKKIVIEKNFAINYDDRSINTLLLKGLQIALKRIEELEKRV